MIINITESYLLKQEASIFLSKTQETKHPMATQSLALRTNIRRRTQQSSHTGKEMGEAGESMEEQRILSFSRDDLGLNEYGFKTWFRCDNHLLSANPNSVEVDFEYQVVFQDLPSQPRTSSIDAAIANFATSEKGLPRLEYTLLFFVSQDLGMYNCRKAPDIPFDPATVRENEFQLTAVSSLGVDTVMSPNQTCITNEGLRCLNFKGQMTAEFTGGAFTAMEALMQSLVEKHLTGPYAKRAPISYINYFGRNGSATTQEAGVETLDSIQSNGESPMVMVMASVCVVSLLIFAISMYAVKRHHRHKDLNVLLRDCSDDSYSDLNAEGCLEECEEEVETIEDFFDNPDYYQETECFDAKLNESSFVSSISCCNSDVEQPTTTSTFNTQSSFSPQLSPIAQCDSPPPTPLRLDSSEDGSTEEEEEEEIEKKEKKSLKPISFLSILTGSLPVVPHLLSFVQEDDNDDIFVDVEEGEDAFAAVESTVVHNEPSSSLPAVIPAPARSTILKCVRKKRKKPYITSSPSKSRPASDIVLIMETIAEEQQEDLKNEKGSPGRKTVASIGFTGNARGIGSLPTSPLRLSAEDEDEKYPLFRTAYSSGQVPQPPVRHMNNNDTPYQLVRSPASQTQLDTATFFSKKRSQATSTRAGMPTRSPSGKKSAPLQVAQELSPLEEQQAPSPRYSPLSPPRTTVKPPDNPFARQPDISYLGQVDAIALTPAVPLSSHASSPLEKRSIINRLVSSDEESASQNTSGTEEDYLGSAASGASSASCSTEDDLYIISAPSGPCMMDYEEGSDGLADYQSLAGSNSNDEMPQNVQFYSLSQRLYPPNLMDTDNSDSSNGGDGQSGNDDNEKEIMPSPDIEENRSIESDWLGVVGSEFFFERKGHRRQRSRDLDTIEMPPPNYHQIHSSSIIHPDRMNTTTMSDVEVDQYSDVSYISDLTGVVGSEIMAKSKQTLVDTAAEIDLTGMMGSEVVVKKKRDVTLVGGSLASNATVSTRDETPSEQDEIPHIESDNTSDLADATGSDVLIKAKKLPTASGEIEDEDVMHIGGIHEFPVSDDVPTSEKINTTSMSENTAEKDDPNRQPILDGDESRTEGTDKSMHYAIEAYGATTQSTLLPAVSMDEDDEPVGTVGSEVLLKTKNAPPDEVIVIADQTASAEFIAMLRESQMSKPEVRPKIASAHSVFPERQPSSDLMIAAVEGTDTFARSKFAAVSDLGGKIAHPKSKATQHKSEQQLIHSVSDTENAEDDNQNDHDKKDVEENNVNQDRVAGPLDPSSRRNSFVEIHAKN